MTILSHDDIAGIQGDILTIVRKCASRGIGEGRDTLKIAVCPEGWEGCVRVLKNEGHPFDVVPQGIGDTAWLRFFLGGRAVWVIADPAMGNDFYQNEWR